MALHDFLPDEKLREVRNLHDFVGMLVFDKWVCNTNGRQTVFFEDMARAAGGGTPEKVAPQTAAAGLARGEVSRGTPAMGEGTREGAQGETGRGRAYKTVMIDQGFCFNAGEWNFPDAPLRGLYARSRVYEGVTGMDSFGPWLERLEKRVTEKVLGELAEEIPPAWYEDDYDAVILSPKSSNRQPFAAWK